eukprot:scaffold4010_cov98-Phaeocystis_antarctica.AAC.9
MLLAMVRVGARVRVRDRITVMFLAGESSTNSLLLRGALAGVEHRCCARVSRAAALARQHTDSVYGACQIGVRADDDFGPRTRLSSTASSRHQRTPGKPSRPAKPLQGSGFAGREGLPGSSENGIQRRQPSQGTPVRLRGQWTPASERLEKTQTYNLSLEASAHDLLAAVTSTRRGPTTHRVVGQGRGLSTPLDRLPRVAQGSPESGQCPSPLPGWVGVREPRGRLEVLYAKNCHHVTRSTWPTATDNRFIPADMRRPRENADHDAFANALAPRVRCTYGRAADAKGATSLHTGRVATDFAIHSVPFAAHKG